MDQCSMFITSELEAYTYTRLCYVLTSDQSTRLGLAHDSSDKQQNSLKWDNSNFLRPVTRWMSDPDFNSQLLVSKKNRRESCKRRFGCVSNAAKAHHLGEQQAYKLWNEKGENGVCNFGAGMHPLFDKLFNKAQLFLGQNFFFCNIWYFRLPSSFIKHLFTLVSGTRSRLCSSERIIFHSFMDFQWIQLASVDFHQSRNE